MPVLWRTGHVQVCARVMKVFDSSPASTNCFWDVPTQMYLTLESNKPWQEQWHLCAGSLSMFSLSLSLPALCQIRNACVAFTINKTKTTQVTGSALISVTRESLWGDFRLLYWNLQGDFYPNTFNRENWGNIPPSRQDVLFSPLLLVVIMIKTCRTTPNCHYVLASFTSQWTMPIS